MTEPAYQHFEVRDSDGTPIVWLYPFDSVSFDTGDDEVTHRAPSDSEEPSIARPGFKITETLKVSAVFKHSSELNAGHRQALTNLFGANEVTQLDQYNRLNAFFNDRGAPPFEVTLAENEYTARSRSAVDRANGAYPTVVVGGVSATYSGYRQGMSVTVTLAVGVEDNDG